MVIDVHSHAMSRDLLMDWARRGRFELSLDEDEMVVLPAIGRVDPEIYELEPRLERLAKAKVDLALVCPLQQFSTWPGASADAELARALNESTAQCVARSGNRFAGLAALALGEPERAVEELTRALAEHGFVGALIGTYAGDRPLDHRSLEPLWAELGRLRIPVFMHPTSAEATPRWDKFTLKIVLNWPNETALAVSRLIFTGTLERNPGLNLILAHGGGTLPFLRGRLDLAYNAPEYELNPDCRANISKPPTQYLNQIYFDTVVTTPESLHFLVDLVGAERVVFGTDDPFEVGDPGGRIALPALGERSPEERKQILGATLERLLG
jgi:aminocarboxymuconate-semialdehyde decarboxylase